MEFKIPLLQYFFGKQKVRQHQKQDFEYYLNLEVQLLQIHSYKYFPQFS